MLCGHNTKIWLFFYYDENDIVENNWLCRTECDEASQYKVIWTKDYLQTRMRYMNEQASRGEVISKFHRLLNDLVPIYDEIVHSVKDTIESFPCVINTIEKHRGLISRIDFAANEILLTDPECEEMAKAALNFIDNVEWLTGDMIIYNDQGECTVNNKDTYYLLTNVYIQKCEESKSKLELFYRFAEECKKRPD